MIEIIDLQSLQNIIKQQKEPIVLVCHAPWCGMCQMYMFVVRSFSDTNPNVLVLGVDLSKYPEISDHYNILNTPTTILIKDGEIIKTLSGPVSQRMLQSYIK
jgi:thioredoxin 1